MANPPDKQPPRRPAQPQDTSPHEPGHVTEDDRGNMTWQWANDAVLQADDTAGAIERLRALVDPNLDIADDNSSRSAIDNPKGLKVGYDPYDSGSLGKTERKKKKDLHELSRWIEAKRRTDGTEEPQE